MNAEHQALAEYLDKFLERRFIRIDEQFDEVNRRIDTLINHVDIKNDKQDELLDQHDLRIRSLESDVRVLTS